MWTPLPPLQQFLHTCQFLLNIWVPYQLLWIRAERYSGLIFPQLEHLWDQKGETIEFLLTSAWIHTDAHRQLFLHSRDLEGRFPRVCRTAYSKDKLGVRRYQPTILHSSLLSGHHFSPKCLGSHCGTFVQMLASPSSR